MTEAHSTAGGNQNMDFELENLKKDHQKDIKILTLENKILELRNENEMLKHKLEIVDLKEKMMNRTVEEDNAQLDTSSNNSTRFITTKERLTWGAKRFFQGKYQNRDLYKSYAEWY